MFITNRFVVSSGVWALENSNFQSFFKITFWVLPLLFIIGQIMERLKPMFLTKIITSIGSVWLGWFLYALLAVVLLSLIRRLGLLLHWDWLLGINKRTVFWLVFIFSIVLIIYGIYNASQPVVRQHTLTLEKSLKKPLTIAMVSDLHIGAIHGRKSIEKLVNLINKEQPDLVLIAGDLVDHNPKFGIKDEVGLAFEKLIPSLGVFAVTGNHEYIGHAEESIKYLSKYGIQYLRDAYVTLDNKIIIAGREDREKQQLGGSKRLTLETILKDADRENLILLMDHQPVAYDKVIENKVDMMFSGHTHKGQIWPLNFITNLVFENHYGLMSKGKTWFYTSNGYGTWGPPMRIGNRPEIGIFHLKND